MITRMRRAAVLGVLLLALAGCNGSSTSSSSGTSSASDAALAQKYTHNMVESALQNQLRQSTGKTLNDVTCDSPVTRITQCQVVDGGNTVAYQVTFAADNDHFTAKQAG
jgi:ABC-type glycerol-3-phosphate transport system substrate-binding protein